MSLPRALVVEDPEDVHLESQIDTPKLSFAKIVSALEMRQTHPEAHHSSTSWNRCASCQRSTDTTDTPISPIHPSKPSILPNIPRRSTAMSLLLSAIVMSTILCHMALVAHLSHVTFLLMCMLMTTTGFQHSCSVSKRVEKDMASPNG